MNRWQENFKAQINAPWSQFIKAINALSSGDLEDFSLIQEILRLKKIADYLDNIINSIDADFIDLLSLQQINSYINNCINNLYAFNENKNLQYISECNSNLDKIYQFINQNMPFIRGNSKNLGQASRRYSEFIDKHIEQINNKIIKLTNNIDIKETQIIDIFNGLKEKEKKINSFEEKIFLGSDEEKSLEGKFQNYHSYIQEFYEKLYPENGDTVSIISQIEEARDDVLEKQKNIEEIESGIDYFFETIFGKEDEIGARNGGHRAEFYKLKEDVNKALHEHIETYDNLEKRINSLLPGATSVGLAASFSETRKSFDEKIRSSSITFYLSIFFIILLGFPFKYVLDIFQNISNQPPDSLSVFNVLALKLPILIPLIWLAIFASKRRSENQRLQQEYAHKENLAKSYQSFKQQIEILPNESKEPLMEKLLDSAISAIGFNPSTTLDGKHGDKPPLQEILEKITPPKQKG